MASPSDNLESMAKSLEDISLYTNATSQSMVGINATFLNVGKAIIEAIKAIKPIRGIVQTGRSFGQSQEMKDQKARERAQKELKREEEKAAKEERRGQALLIKESMRAAKEFEKTQQREERLKNKKEAEEKKKKKAAIESTPDPNFKNIISGAGGGIAGLFASVAIETKNFVASIMEAYGSGGLIGLTKAAFELSKVFTQMPSAMLSIVRAVGPFVTALDPGLMAKLALAFSDLMAVVGYGLRPVIVMAIAAIRLFADMLLPVMRMLAPAMATLASSVMTMLIPILQIWVNSIVQLIPVLNSLAPLFRYVGETISIMMPVINAGLMALAIALNGLLGVISLVVGAIQTMVVGVLQAGAYIVSWIPGTGDTSKNMEKAADGIAESAAKSFGEAKDAFGRMFEGANVPAPEKSAGMAAKGASFAGIGDLGKNLMQAAFGSSTEKIAMDQLNAQKEANGILNQIAAALWGQNGGAKMAGVRN